LCREDPPRSGERQVSKHSIGDLADGDPNIPLDQHQRTHGMRHKADVFYYIERFYNAKRRHSTSNYLSPIEFEMNAQLT
jgi:transposase InsO family protein